MFVDIAKITEGIARARVLWNLLAGLRPLLEQMIDAIERAFPVSGQGATKREMVKAQVALVFGAIEQAVLTFEQVWPTIETLISGIVTMRKASGAWGGPAPTDPPA